MKNIRTFEQYNQEHLEEGVFDFFKNAQKDGVREEYINKNRKAYEKSKNTLNDKRSPYSRYSKIIDKASEDSGEDRNIVEDKFIVYANIEGGLNKIGIQKPTYNLSKLLWESGGGMYQIAL